MQGYQYLKEENWIAAQEAFAAELEADEGNWKAALGMVLARLCLADGEALRAAPVSYGDDEYYRRALRHAPEEIAATLEQCRKESDYLRADKAFWAAENDEQFVAAGEMFLAAGDWKDASARYYECQVMSEKIRLEMSYRQATALMDANNADALSQARYLFTNLGTYRDSAALAEECTVRAGHLQEKKRRQRHIVLGVLAALTLIVAAMSIWQFYGRYTACRAQAQEIANNLPGRTFRYEFTDDDDFEAHYAEKKLVKGTVYWLTEEIRELEFREDGTVYYFIRSAKTVQAYPVEMEEPTGYETEYDGTYSTYSVAVTMNGEIYLALGEGRYPIAVDENNVPTAIYNYYTEPLT